MQAAYCTASDKFEIREIPMPLPDAGDAVIAVRSCGICGSDLHWYHGVLPPPDICPGHEISGEVIDVGEGVTAVNIGDRVAVEPTLVCGRCAYCATGNYQRCTSMQIVGQTTDGGFAEYLRVPAERLFRLPEGVDFEVGALAEPLAVAVHGVRLGGVRLGDHVLVQGAGTIGLMAAAAARAAGASEVWITARHSHQARAAEALGATCVFSDNDADLGSAAMEEPVDVVVETVGGSADTINEAIHLVRRGGSVVVLGVFTGSPALSALMLMVKEVRLVGAMTYGRDGTRADFDVALDLLDRQAERFRSLITHRRPLAQIAEGFALAADKRAGSIKVAILP